MTLRRDGRLQSVSWGVTKDRTARTAHTARTARGALTASITKHRTARTETPHHNPRSGSWRTVSHYQYRAVASLGNCCVQEAAKKQNNDMLKLASHTSLTKCKMFH